jgi:hypothetical protein
MIGVPDLGGEGVVSPTIPSPNLISQCEMREPETFRLCVSGW